jgi:predicted AlkP superfamily phosphohydrolase/phosphomutase
MVLGRRLFIFGLDAAPPRLLFDEFRGELPNFSRILDRALYGPLRSCDPPITIPAWMVMMTGREPGELGLYGFRHRKGYSYEEFTIPSSRSIGHMKVWDYLGRAGLKSFVMGIPPTYPPYKINGWMVSGFLTPGPDTNYTYPSILKREIRGLVGDYIFDVPFRREDRVSLYKELVDMTRQHGMVMLHMARVKPWDLFISMEIGLDRVQHAFWKYMDRGHPNHVYDNFLSNAILEYYKLLDDILGRLLNILDEDDVLMIVSDHGAKMMKGAFAINDWLIDEGFLVVKDGVKPGVNLGDVEVDWGRSIAWGWGGYYARVFLNVEGREASGVVGRDEYLDVRRELAGKILSIRGPGGEGWRNIVYFPEDLYNVVNGNPPDLMVYFDDLFWRSAGTLGYENYYLPENDTGPDDAVHDYDGVFILYDRKKNLAGTVECSIYDIFPTILDFYGIDIDFSCRGRSLLDGL